MISELTSAPILCHHAVILLLLAAYILRSQCGLSSFEGSSGKQSVHIREPNNGLFVECVWDIILVETMNFNVHLNRRRFLDSTAAVRGLATR